jgi:oxygen-independent coproporphyrinogen III oxidase
MNTDLSKKYDMLVPRYTSYPTAPHFNDAVTPDVYRRWLGELERDTDLSLYFHIPFCDSMCWFCGCYTKIVKRYEPVHDYLEVLLQEIDQVADALPGRLKARHLHWGGGSPTMLTGADWQRTIERLRTRFDVDETAEIAVEMDPRDTTEDYVKALASAGVNRTSIGVQDFHPEVQQAINRIQPFDVTKQVVDWLRQHGIPGLNMDLMYGLPHQTTARVLEMVDKGAALKPDRVALFGYAHVPWMRPHQKQISEDVLPGTEARWEQFLAATARLLDHGYVRIGFDHFALPDDDLTVALNEGRLRRNFQGYSVDESPVLLGLGASAIGYMPQGYVQNVLPLRDYRNTVASGSLATIKGFAMSDEDRLRGAIIQRLMCDMTVDLADLCPDPSQFAPELERLLPLRDDGILTLDATRITLTEEGRPFIRVAASMFDTYLNVGEKRHSKAV